MSRIYVTGDTHGSLDFIKLHYFAGEHPDLTFNDYMIVCGDFGAVWSQKTLNADLKRYKELNFTVLFVDGNHENFDILNSYPVKKWHGGKVHKIAPNIIHLMRGQIYTIDNKKFFTFGGGTSVDRMFRTKGVSWWEEELPSVSEINEAHENLKKSEYKVDYIITHSCDERALYYKPLNKCLQTKSVCHDNVILSQFEEQVHYNHWYFGHYHLNGDITGKKTVLFDEIREIK